MKVLRADARTRPPGLERSSCEGVFLDPFFTLAGGMVSLLVPILVKSSRPPFSAVHFPGHCFGLIPGPGSFASSAFPVPPELHHWVPSDKAAARFGSRSHSLLGAPRKWGKKREKIQLCLTYMLSRIAFSAVRSPTVPSLEHGLSSRATPGTEACNAAGGAFRPQWREWPAPES